MKQIYMQRTNLIIQRNVEASFPRTHIELDLRIIYVLEKRKGYMHLSED